MNICTWSLGDKRNWNYKKEYQKMGKLFGTDGIRGVVGKNLTAELAFHVGQAVAVVLQEELGRKPVITIGKDTTEADLQKFFMK